MAEPTLSETFLPKNYKKSLNWNVIEETQFRARVRNVFDQVATMLTNTLGPYGATAIIEKFGEMHITKDGWNILKKISFDDPTEQNLLQLLVNISAQVVIKVGDGSTSSIVAANSILKKLESSEQLKKVRPKEVIDSLKRAVESITGEVLNRSTKIDAAGSPDLDEIYRLAMISTNGDTEVSDIIRTIYKETENPSIEFIKARSAKTTYEIVEGYKALITYLDAIYATNDDGICNINKPLILMFDHKVDLESHYNTIIYKAMSLAVHEGRRLVVIAPHFDSFMLNHIRTQANQQMHQHGTTAVVYTRAMLSSNLFQEQFNDFAIMTGGMIIRDTDVYAFNSEDPEKVPDISSFLGQVDSIAVGPDTTLIRGFYNRNEEMYQVALRDARAKFSKLEQTHQELNIVDSQLYEVKKRLSKLKGIMGVIHVGGQSGLEKASNYDLVEDAVKACESAYHYGYNIGGNLIIPIAIDHLLETQYKEVCVEQNILMLLRAAFCEVFTKVLGRKYTTEPEAFLHGIVDEAIEKELCYDLITDTYSADVINPCHTDVEILRAATSIVALLLSSNQYISIKADQGTN